MHVRITRLDPSLPLPTQQHAGDAGYDLHAREMFELSAGGGRALVPTGVAVQIPPGYAGFVLPRSGLALKHGVTCLNTPGLIDAPYSCHAMRKMATAMPPTTRGWSPGRMPAWCGGRRP